MPKLQRKEENDKKHVRLLSFIVHVDVLDTAINSIKLENMVDRWDNNNMTKQMKKVIQEGMKSDPFFRRCTVTTVD